MRNLSKIGAGRPVALAVLAAALGLGVSGCAEMTDAWHEMFPPSPTPALADLQTLKADETKLFAQLQQPAPACLYPAASPLFAAVEADIQKTKADAAGDGPTTRGLADLDTALGDLKTGVSGGTTCTPDITAKQQTLFDAGVNSLIANEQNRAKGA